MGFLERNVKVHSILRIKLKTRFPRYLVLLVSFLVGCLSNVGAQNVTVSTQPLNIVDFWNGPNVNLGVEFPFNSKWKNYIQAGRYINAIPSINENQWESLTGGFISNEVRMYFLPDSNKRFVAQSYWGFEAQYGDQYYTRGDTLHLETGSEFRKYDNQRTYAGINVNFGMTWKYHSGLFMGIRFGVGGRYNRVINNLTQEEADSRNFGDWNSPTGWIQKKGSRIIPKFNLAGFRIGYSFKR